MVDVSVLIEAVNNGKVLTSGNSTGWFVEQKPEGDLQCCYLGTMLLGLGYTVAELSRLNVDANYSATLQDMITARTDINIPIRLLNALIYWSDLNVEYSKLNDLLVAEIQSYDNVWQPA